MFRYGQWSDYSRVMTSADTRNNGGFVHTVVIIFGLILLISGLILNIVGVINPSWQVVDIREFRAEHHHGLWLDCTKTQRPLSAEHLTIHNDGSLHCTYKFDQQASDVIDQNIDDADGSSAAAEAVHHQFFFWQKSCLVCIFISLITGGLALISGTCSPCSPPCALIASILTFIAFLASTIAAIIFFFAAHRVDNRFVQGLVGTYEQTIGSSFYVFVLGTVLLLLSTLMSIVGAYQLLNKSSDNDLSYAMQDFPPMFHNQRTRV